MRRREAVAAWLAKRDDFLGDPLRDTVYLKEADDLLTVVDQVTMWTLNDVADWTALRTSTLSSYRTRSQMPEASLSYGRTHLWEPDDIKVWRPRGYPHARRG